MRACVRFTFVNMSCCCHARCAAYYMRVFSPLPSGLQMNRDMRPNIRLSVSQPMHWLVSQPTIRHFSLDFLYGRRRTISMRGTQPNGPTMSTFNENTHTHTNTEPRLFCWDVKTFSIKYMPSAAVSVLLAIRVETCRRDVFANIVCGSVCVCRLQAKKQLCFCE